MQNILLISNTQSYLNISIKDRLKEMSYEVIMAKGDTDEVNKIKQEISSVLIFVDEEMIANQQVLIYLKDRAIENDLPIFMLGDANEIEEARKFLPGNLIQMTFARPIDINEVIRTVDTYVKKYGNSLKKKILVVDDSGAMLRNVKGWLEGKYLVTLANSGAMAMKYLATNRPDLVLLDYEMPVVDGKQVLEMIRTEMEYADIPVIFLTSKSDKESVMKVMSLKPEGYMLKTMEPRMIIQTVDEFFEKQKIKKLK